MKQRIAILILASVTGACATGVGEKPRQMEVVVPSRLPAELREAALAPPPVPAEIDEAGDTLIPAPAKVPVNYYETADRMDVLDPLIVTDNRAPRGTPAVASSPKPATSAPAVLAMEEVIPQKAKPEPIQISMASSVPTAEIPKATRGGYAIHLASYREESKALAGWDIYKSRHGAELSALSPIGARVSVPDQGDFIRLLAGPFPSEMDAQSVCDELAYSDQYCRVMPYQGAPL